MAVKPAPRSCAAQTVWARSLGAARAKKARQSLQQLSIGEKQQDEACIGFVKLH